MSLNEKQYTTGELAVLFMVAPRTVRKWIDRDRLIASRVGKSSHRRVAHVDLLDWLNRVWPTWRLELRAYHFGPDGRLDDWRRGVRQQRVAQWPWLRDWFELLDGDIEFATPGMAPSPGGW